MSSFTSCDTLRYVMMILLFPSGTIHALAPFVLPRGATTISPSQQRLSYQPYRSHHGFFHHRSSSASSSSSSSSVLRCSMVIERNNDKTTSSTTGSFDSHRWDLPNAPPASSSSSSASSSPSLLKKFRTMHDINVALDQMAEACGQQQQQQQQLHSSPSEIIAKAAQAEELWNEVVLQYHQAVLAVNNNINHNENSEEDTTTTTPPPSQQQPQPHYLKPDVITFNTVLKAWSKTAQSLADYKQQSVLFGSTTNSQQQQQQQRSSSSSRHVAITSIPVYTARDAAERATMLLTQQEEAFNAAAAAAAASATAGKDGVIIVRPDTTSYNIAIDAWAKSRVDDAPLLAERLLTRLIETRRDLKPDSLTYNGLVDAWSYSGRPESLDKLEQIMDQMQVLYEQQQGPNHPTANTVISVTKGQYNRRGDTSSSSSLTPTSLIVKPTIRTVNSILHAHAKRAQEYSAKDPAMAQRAADDARALLNRMTAKYEATQDVDYQPDVTSYTTVMDAYGRCATYEAALQAEQLLQELKDLFQRTKNVQRHEPNIRTYTTLIAAWAKVNDADEAPQRAQAFLEEIKQLKHYNPSTQQFQPMYPNARTYLAVIQCWARSKDPTKAQRALQILLTMKDLYKTTQNPELRPNLVTYNAAIDACAKCQGTTAQQTDALKISFAILKAIQAEPDMRPNHVTFATLLKATAALLPSGEERNTVAKAVFSKSQEAGMVDYYTLANLRKAVEANVLQSLLHDLQDRTGFIDYNKIPQPWCKNVMSLRK